MMTTARQIPADDRRQVEAGAAGHWENRGHYEKRRVRVLPDHSAVKSCLRPAARGADGSHQRIIDAWVSDGRVWIPGKDVKIAKAVAVRQDDALPSAARAGKVAARNSMEELKNDIVF